MISAHEFYSRITRFSIGCMIEEARKLDGEIQYEVDGKPNTVEIKFSDGSTFKAKCHHGCDGKSWFDSHVVTFFPRTHKELA